MSNWTLVHQTIDCLLVFPQCLRCSHSVGLCSGTELEDSRAKTMSADSFSERAKLLLRVTVTTHMLCMCTRGWTWTIMLCCSPYTKAVCRLCHNYIFWVETPVGSLSVSMLWKRCAGLIETNAAWLLATAEHCTGKRKAPQWCTYLPQVTPTLALAYC